MILKNYQIQIKTIFLFLFITISCSSENVPTSETGENHSELSPKFNLTFGHDMPVQSAQHVAALKYSEMVNTKTNGQVQVKVFPNQTLGTDQEMIEMARAGKLDIILPPTAKLSTLVPESQIADLPFFFETRKSIYSFLDGKPGKQLLNLLNPHGLIGVAFWESGFKQFSANREISSEGFDHDKSFNIYYLNSL